MNKQIESGKVGFHKARGRVLTEYGRYNEERVAAAFAEALKEGLTPNWITGYRIASAQDQEKHIDAWVDTDVGPIKLQIKSSLEEVEKAKQKLGRVVDDIAFIYIGLSDGTADIIKYCTEAVGTLRNKYLQTRS